MMMSIDVDGWWFDDYHLHDVSEYFLVFLVLWNTSEFLL